MKGILIVAHGSRAEATKKTFEGIVTWFDKMPGERYAMPTWSLVKKALKKESKN